MPAEYLSQWNPAAKVAAYEALVLYIDGDANPAYITIHSADDTVLASVDLTDPSGTVDPGTGQTTFTPDGREDAAPAGGEASYASIRKGDGTVQISLPCAEGTTPTVGYCMLRSLTVIQDDPLEIVSITVG